ncbi:MAG: hypothetical protein PHG58_09500 [Clostridia bacterium]|nr:hypothetical protein [Clostridia bacterium]
MATLNGVQADHMSIYRQKPFVAEKDVSDQEHFMDMVNCNLYRTPLEKISPRLAINYHCMIDSVLKYGKH